MPIKKKNDDLKSELNRLLPIHSNDDPNHVWNKNQQQMLTKGTGIDSKWIRKMRNQEGEKLSVDVLYDVSYKLSSNVEALKNTWPFHENNYSKEEEAEQIKKIVNDGLIPGICYKKIVFDESKAGKLTRETKKIFYFEINKYLSYLFEKWSHSKEYKGEKKNKWARFDHLVNLLDFKQKWEAALKNNVRDAFSMFGTIDNDFAIEIKKLLSNSLYEINGLKMVDGEDLRIEYKESIFVDKKESQLWIELFTEKLDVAIYSQNYSKSEKSIEQLLNSDLKGI